MVSWHVPPSSLGGVENFKKSLLGGGGVRNFYFSGGSYIVGRANFAGGSHNFEVKIKIAQYINTFQQVYYIKIFSFSFLYFSSIANVNALSVLHIKYPNKHSNQQFNVKVILQKNSNPCQTCSDLINIYKFDNALTFKLKSISLFWHLDNFLEKDETGLLFQINTA